MTRPAKPTPAVKPSAARRKLIRAGFAVPAIATVASGSALAATSASCFARQLGSPSYPGVTPGGSSTTDTYIRVQLGKRTLGSNDTYYVDGNNLNAIFAASGGKLAKSSSYGMGVGKFQLFDTVANSEVNGVLDSTTFPNGGSYTASGGRYAVLRFMSDGKVVGVGKSSTEKQSAVQMSCWSSLAP